MVDSLYLVMKGLVREMAGDDVVGAYREHETFDCRALATGKAVHRFVVHEEALLCAFPREDVLTLIDKNPAFGAYFFAAVSDKFGQLAQKRGELQSLFTAKISDVGFRSPVFLDASISISDATRLMKEQHRHSIIVRDESKIGIFTTGDCRDIIANGISYQTPLGECSQFSLLTCENSDYLFTALLMMTQGNVRHIVVTDNGTPIGVLSQADLLSFFSNHSLLIAQQLELATTVDDLVRATKDMETLVTTLAIQGMKMPQLARLVQALNAQFMARLWQMVAPPEIYENTSLLAMGSEGRGEQILKSDQDNALILAEGLDEKEVEEASNRFTEEMIRLGYPLCPGGIMVNQKLWRHTEKGWCQVLQKWARQPQGDPLMNLIIFLDAKTVTGSSTWLASCMAALRAGLRDDASWFSRMALPIEQFPNQRVEGGFWWQMLNREESVRLDIKKAGIFPIVHGIRVLALENDVEVTNTFDRIEALVSRGILEKALANDLNESLSFLMRLRLDAGVEALREKRTVSNDVNTTSLSTLDKDLLKDALLVVKRFKQMINQRYHLDRL